MSAEPYVCELDPETGITLKAYLFTSVDNIEEVRDAVTSGAWRCAVVKARLVPSPRALAVAANIAALADRAGALRTRSVYAEILYNLSISKKISQSLATFGAQTERDIVVCFLEAGGCEEALAGIRGTPQPMSHLPTLTDTHTLNKLYKLNNLKPGADHLDVILTRLATKSFVSH